jgi:Xaa-Pro dipeptidase
MPTSQALVDAVDRVQQQLVDRVRSGQDYAVLHLDCHRLLAGLLRDLGIVRMEPEAMLESGVSSVFFPHGLGHLLGLQVHDIGGFQASADGGRIEKPVGHPALRLTRTLAPGMVVTIEPGIYFIDTLLARLREGPEATAVDWSAIEHLRRFGGVRTLGTPPVSTSLPSAVTTTSSSMRMPMPCHFAATPLAPGAM